jgi:predicted dehydrogenase
MIRRAAAASKCGVARIGERSSAGRAGGGAGVGDFCRPGCCHGGIVRVYVPPCCGHGGGAVAAGGGEHGRKGSIVKRFRRPADVKVGVIGYGGAFNMGPEHLRGMQQAGMTPTAVADVDRRRLAAAGRDFPGIQTYDSVARLLRDSDANLLTLITPHNTHARLAVQCLDAGRHVVSEKPMAITTAECDRMIAAARKNKVMLSVYHNRHWDGCILEAVKRIRSGVIGDVFRVEAHGGGYHRPGDWWRSSKSISGGIHYDWGVHMVEYALQILTGRITEVSGHVKRGFWAPKTAWKDDTNEDEVFLTVRFDDGTWLSLCNSSIDSNPKRGMLEITGTKGTYIMDGRSWETITHAKGETVIRKGLNGRNQWGRYYREVADHLVKGAPLTITAAWARRPIHILDLATRSARKGAAIKAKYS